MPSVARHALSLTGVLVLAACNPPAAPPGPPPASQAPPMSAVDRGKYLVNAMACDDCHTPFKLGPNGPEPDMSRRLSGYPETTTLVPAPKPTGSWFFVGSAEGAFVGPWGTSYAANLTSDPNTGIGQNLWTEDLFVKAIREGKHMGTSRPILPPMPWMSFRNLSDDDLKAIFAFLRTVPPVNNHVPDPIIAEPPAAPTR